MTVGPVELSNFKALNKTDSQSDRQTEGEGREGRERDTKNYIYFLNLQPFVPTI
jgi:hypothetical protein